MSEIVVEAHKRVPGGKNANRRLRVSGKMPAVFYGRGSESIAVSVDPLLIHEILHSESGHNTIFSLNVEGHEFTNAMVKDYQLDPVKGNLIHADFLQISMDQLLELSVDIDAVGEAEGVKMGGIMDVVTRAIEVECLPADIPETIRVDVSNLKIGEYIRMKDIPSNPKVRILTDPEAVIVTVIPPKAEVEAEVPLEEVAEPEVIRRGKVAEEAPEGEKKPESPTDETT